MTEDESIEIGDFVLVPAGKDNHEAVVEVVNIEYFSEENLPLPIEKQRKLFVNGRMVILIYRNLNKLFINGVRLI